jgi:hypothetical protein
MTAQYRLNPLSHDRDYDFDFAGNSLLGYSGKVFLSKGVGSSRKNVFACMATWMGGEYFLTTWDTVNREIGESLFRYEDILVEWMGKSYPVEWVVELPHKPLLLMKCDKQHLRTPAGNSYYYYEAIFNPPASLYDILDNKDRSRLWRIGYTTGVFGENVEPDGLPYLSPGYDISGMHHRWYRGPRNEIKAAKYTICIHCNFVYPHREDYGSPIVLQNGQLAGILISGDLGSDYRHQGAIIPLVLVLPTIQLWVQRDRENKLGDKGGVHVHFVPQY